MAPIKNDWVFKFEVGDPRKHRKGFTVYKLTSFVYPRNAPDAVTTLVVWKRYNDFKRLHLKTIEVCKALRIRDTIPKLPKVSYFKRFDEEVISNRIIAAKELLNYIGNHKALFLSETFTKFCQEGYQINEKTMGQSPLNPQNGEIFCEDPQWKWNGEMRWLPEQDVSSLRSESSEDGSASISETTESGGSLQSPVHNNAFEGKSKNTLRENYNNNSSDVNNCCESARMPYCKENDDVEHNNLCNDNSLEVEDPAGPGLKPLDVPPPDDDSEIVCHSEHPISPKHVWLTVPSAADRLSAYHVVGISDPVLIVMHRACPSRRLVLKVLRKSSWPMAGVSEVGEPRPVPFMVRLFDSIETEDAIFVVMEYAPRGLLWDHVRRLKDRRSPPNASSTSDLDIDSLVANAQQLLISVTRTLEQSDAAASSLNRDLESVESVLVGRGHKPRSASAFPRPRLERRLSCDDTPNYRPRTAHGSLDRAVCWSRLPEGTVREWATALVVSLDTLHSRGVIWRDLYPGNLLICEGGRLILTFQHQWCGVENRLHRKALAGHFVAPEARSIFQVTCTADWWSVGVILYELLTGVALMTVHPNGLSSHTVLDLPDFLSIESQSLLKELLQVDPNDRLGSGINGSEDIKCHPFFKNIDWESKYDSDKFM